MENISYIGLSQQMALRQKMDVTANNLANMSTPGFKSQSVLFLEYLNAPKETGVTGKDAIRQVVDAASYRDLSTGVLKQTYNDLDFAVQGDGYFAVQTPFGTRYTRDGSFALNDQREIVNKSGYAVLNTTGQPIIIPEGASKITVGKNGAITTDAGEAGQLKVVTFDNEQKLIEEGENLLSSGDMNELPVERLHVVQGALEGSNVNSIVEMNSMIEILRLYQSSQRMLMSDHERIRGAIQRLTKV